MPDVNPLVAIRDQERALAQKIRAAQERATARIADARARADALKQTAEREGVRDADALYQAGLERARAQAGEIEKNGQAQSVARADAGRAHLARAVESIIAFVLPRVEK
ncbi:MAG: hypothetical protein HZC40_05815 [Chloroflexi bacterium]|nr:hypothetical protein [Chloroflexota bacterium]